MEARLLIEGRSPGPWNMALDEALLASAVATGLPCLRFYGWEEPTISLGYFQAYDDRQSHAASRSCAIVRRTTGGGAIVHDQELLWSGGFGMADPERGTPARADTIYSICSISKLFTAIAVMRERDLGHLRLDDPVAEHLPWFELARPLGEGEVTIEGILTHASGIMRETAIPYWTGAFDFPERDQVVATIPRQEALYPPERTYQYSNLGFTLVRDKKFLQGRIHF